MAAVEVRVHPTATAEDNGWGMAPAVPIAVDDPDMAREWRKALIHLRRVRVVEWRAGLEQLPHFNPAFPYGHRPRVRPQLDYGPRLQP